MANSSSGAVAPLLLVAASTIWGLATVLNKALLTALSPQLLLVMQLLPSAALLWVCTILARRALPRGRLFWLSVALGILNPGISYSLSLLGLDRIPAGVAALLWSTEPFMILCLAAWALAEPVTPRTLLVIVTGFAGAGLATGALNGGQASGGDALGILCLLSAVFLCAIYTVWSRKIGIAVDPLPLLTLQQSAGLLWAILAFAVTGQGSAIEELQTVPGRELLVAGLSGLLYYAAAYWLYLIALRHVSAAIAGSSFNVIPLVAISAAFLFLGERLSFIQLTGAALILASVFVLFRLPLSPAATG